MWILTITLYSVITRTHCNLLTLDPAVNQETGASARKYQGITLTCGRVEFGSIATPTGSRWMSNNYIIRCHRWLDLVGVSCSWSLNCSSRQWEPAPDRGIAALGDPRLSSPAEWERSAAIVRGTWSQYVAVCSVSNSPLTHNPFTTLSRIKCERYIFLKNCVCSSLLLIMFPHVYVYVLLYHGYTITRCRRCAIGVFWVWSIYQKRKSTEIHPVLAWISLTLMTSVLAGHRTEKFHMTTSSGHTEVMNVIFCCSVNSCASMCRSS